MIVRETKSFQCSSNEYELIKKQLKIHNIEYSFGKDSIIFEIQLGNNVVTKVTVFNRDDMAEEDKLFIFNLYPNVCNFKEIIDRLKKKPC